LAETEQVAFHTGNIVPGIDFTNDPLLQGRNFSYLDTQLKRLGGPNFTHLPVNAPRCPFHHFQQDGHMAFYNPIGRANYEPNSWGGEMGGPREDPASGFRSFPEPIEGEKVRTRSQTFSDHYSQARQFYLSQTNVEQGHIASAFTFELSKVETVAIRARMVAHLFNVDEDLALTVGKNLRLKPMPKSAEAAMPTKELKPSPKLSILLNGPERFKGRKVGALVTDGVDITLVKGLYSALEAEGALLEIVAPNVGGVEASDGTWVEAKQMLGGGPSVLYDAVAVLASAENAALLANDSAAKDFVADAFAHCKFIAYSADTVLLFDKTGLTDALDEGCLALNKKADAKAFVAMCRNLRFWEREPQVRRK
jgi:catalase